VNELQDFSGKIMVLLSLQVDTSAAGEYAELCVHLYADYCPARLMDFLQGSQTYPLEAALEVAEQRGMVDEQVRACAYVTSKLCFKSVWVFGKLCVCVGGTLGKLA
jgi:hypothetical protein